MQVGLTSVIRRVGALFSAQAEGHVFLSLKYSHRSVAFIFVVIKCFDSTLGYQLLVLNVNWTDLLEKIRVNCKISCAGPTITNGWEHAPRPDSYHISAGHAGQAGSQQWVGNSNERARRGHKSLYWTISLSHLHLFLVKILTNNKCKCKWPDIL